MLKHVLGFCGKAAMIAVVLAMFVARAAAPAEAPATPGVSFAQDFTAEQAPAMFSIGLATGFPTYQVAALTAGVQMEFIGFQLKGGWTVAGPYFGAQVRGYLPIPAGVPVYIGVGGGVYGSSQQFHIVAGTHVPITEHVRLDFEAGVANVPLLTERAWVPHIAAGISYSIAVDTRSAGASPVHMAGGTGGAAGTCEAAEPDASRIPGAVNQVVTDIIQSARATYGSVYTDLQYAYDIVSVDHQHDRAEVTVQFQGSVRERLSGEPHSEAGVGGVALTWAGCGWRAGDVWW